MERVNTEDSPYELSLEITASGNAQNLIAGSSIYSAITESDARLGGAVSLSYYNGDVEKIKLTYEIGESYISNEGSEYAKNCVDLQGIKRYNIFRYFEELNMLLPVATEFDEENNTLFAETDELGTYCVLDMEVLLQTFGVNPDGSQTEQVERQMYAGVNDGYNICFIIDTRKGVITDEQLENIKNEIIAFMSNAVTNGKLIGVTICVQNYTDFSNNKSSAELLGHYSTVEELTAALKEVKLDNKYDDNDFVRCCITDGIGLLSYQSRGTNNYVFDIFSQTDCIFNRTKFDEIERNAISTGVNISFITDNRKIDSYQTEIPEETKGVVLNSLSNFAKKAYNHVFEEPLVEFDGFSAILATGYQTVELKEELNSFNDCHSDDDNITDWDEVDVDYWASCGLITFDDNNNVVLPTVEQCMNYSEASYVVEALDRLQSELGKDFGAAIAIQHIMPVTSDPTREDSDGDKVLDIYDKNPLIPIDEFSPCLNSEYGCDLKGVENHDMVINLPDNCKSYICTNCGYSVCSPEINDYDLSISDYLLIKSLKKVANKLLEIDDKTGWVKYYMYECTFRMIDHIRSSSNNNYEYCDCLGNYISPITYLLTNENIDVDSNELFVNISVDEYKRTYDLQAAYSTAGKALFDLALMGVDCYLAGISLPDLSSYIGKYAIYFEMGRIAVSEEIMRAMIEYREPNWVAVGETMFYTTLDALVDVEDTVGGYNFSPLGIIKTYFMPIITQYCITDYEYLPERGSGSKPEQGEKFKYYVVVEMLTENNGGYRFTYNYDFYGYNSIDLTFEICNAFSDGQKGKYRNAVRYNTEDLDGGLKLRHYITGIIGDYFFVDTNSNGTYEKKYI